MYFVEFAPNHIAKIIFGAGLTHYIALRVYNLVKLLLSLNKMPIARDMVLSIFRIFCYQVRFSSIVTPRNFEFDSRDKGSPSIQILVVESMPACVLLDKIGLYEI